MKNWNDQAKIKKITDFVRKEDKHTINAEVCLRRPPGPPAFMRLCSRCSLRFIWSVSSFWFFKCWQVWVRHFLGTLERGRVRPGIDQGFFTGWEQCYNSRRAGGRADTLTGKFLLTYREKRGKEKRENGEGKSKKGKGENWKWKEKKLQNEERTFFFFFFFHFSKPLKI